MVRRGVFERTVDPFVPVAPVAVVIRDVEIIQEIGVAATPGRGQGGLCDHGIAFQQRFRKEQGGDDAWPHFPDQVIHPPERLPVGQLHLGDVAGFMDSQLRQPGLGKGPIRFGSRIEVHSPGSPGDGAVGIGMKGMEDDRHFSPLEGPGRHPGALSDGRPPGLQGKRIGMGKGVHPFGIDKPEMPGFHLTPPAEGIAPVLVELGGYPLRAGKGEE